MNRPQDTQERHVRPPALYRITVKGHIAPRWQGRLAGMKVLPQESDGPTAEITVLEGLIRDQAELSGVLNTLYEMRAELLNVEVVDTENEQTKGDER